MLPNSSSEYCSSKNASISICPCQQPTINRQGSMLFSKRQNLKLTSPPTRGHLIALSSYCSLTLFALRRSTLPLQSRRTVEARKATTLENRSAQPLTQKIGFKSPHSPFAKAEGGSLARGRGGGLLISMVPAEGDPLVKGGPLASGRPSSHDNYFGISGNSARAFFISLSGKAKSWSLPDR